MFLVEPDKHDTKRHLRGFLCVMHYQQIEWRKESETNEKADAVLFELSDVANAL